MLENRKTEFVQLTTRASVKRFGDFLREFADAARGEGFAPSNRRLIPGRAIDVVASVHSLVDIPLELSGESSVWCDSVERAFGPRIRALCESEVDGLPADEFVMMRVSAAFGVARDGDLVLSVWCESPESTEESPVLVGECALDIPDWQDRRIMALSRGSEWGLDTGVIPGVDDPSPGVGRTEVVSRMIRHVKTMLGKNVSAAKTCGKEDSSKQHTKASARPR